MAPPIEPSLKRKAIDQDNPYAWCAPRPICGGPNGSQEDLKEMPQRMPDQSPNVPLLPEDARDRSLSGSEPASISGGDIRNQGPKLWTASRNLFCEDGPSL